MTKAINAQLTSIQQVLHQVNQAEDGDMDKRAIFCKLSAVDICQHLQWRLRWLWDLPFPADLILQRQGQTTQAATIASTSLPASTTATAAARLPPAATATTTASAPTSEGLQPLWAVISLNDAAVETCPGSILLQWQDIIPEPELPTLVVQVIEAIPALFMAHPYSKNRVLALSSWSPCYAIKHLVVQAVKVTNSIWKQIKLMTLQR